MPATGSFRVFAPPPPRGSGDSDARDPGASASDLPGPEAENESASALADLADLRDNLPPSPAPALERLERLEPAQPGPSEEAEPEEVDELDELDEDLDEEPAPVTRSAPPPKAPPPPPSNLFKPRPLLPIVPPKKK